MKLLKKPIFWIVVVFLCFLGYVAAGYSAPANVQFVNETGGELKNVRLLYGSGELSVPSLPQGPSPLGQPIKLPAGELTVRLQTASGRPHSDKFKHRTGPRETVTFHIVDADNPTSPPELRASWVSTEENFVFNLRSTED
jgi:hypothetical protein